MSPGKISKKVVADRIAWVDQMVSEIKSLPFTTYDEFMKDKRNIWATESCLRRALEALFDIGRHILAKTFGKGVSEYKEIANELGQVNVLSKDDMELLRTLGGYRNRLVHFYHEVSARELFDICKNELDDLLRIKKAYLYWIKENPDKVDETL
jgi:uncharacterized protein YutE (UPF0331/DUF86 family)